MLTAPLRVRAAWAANDATAFADMFADNGSLLLGDQQLSGREEIRTYLVDAFRAGLKGTSLQEQPRLIRKVTDSVAIVVMEGGIVGSDGTLAPDAETRGTWVVVKQDGDWRIMSYQTSPLRG